MTDLTGPYQGGHPEHLTQAQLLGGGRGGGKIGDFKTQKGDFLTNL